MKIPKSIVKSLIKSSELDLKTQVNKVKKLNRERRYILLRAMRIRRQIKYLETIQ